MSPNLSFNPVFRKASINFSRNIKPLLAKLLCYSLSFSLIFAPAFDVQAQDNHIVIDNGAHAGGNAPNFGQQSGGIDVLNITRPSAAGVSHNRFNEFNVGEKGLIVNNQNMRDYSVNSSSALSGQHVEFNHNLGTGTAARIILNEVNGTNPSHLKGYTEIYGRKADYILANPNGINIAGAGFINVGRLSMIAGQPNVINGEIRDFRIIPGGIIKVEGVGEHHFGLHAGASKAELVADMINIAGNVYADGELALLSGDYKFDYASGLASSNGSTVASVAIDSSALGGMRAGSIRIHASQTGLGVNVASTLVADTSNIEITADGNIVFKDAAARGDLNVASTGGGIELAGKSVYAESVSIAAHNNLENRAEVIANRSIRAEAGEIRNTGKLVSQGSSEYAANDIHNYGQFYSGSGLTLNTTGDFINYRDSAVLAGGDIDFTVGRNLVNYRAEIYSLGNILFNGQEGGLAALSDSEKAFETNGDLTALYDNPHIADHAPPGSHNGETQQTAFENTEEDGEYEIYLTGLDLMLTLQAEAFDEADEPGKVYGYNGFTIILGVPGKDENDDPLLDENGATVYVMPDDEDALPFTIFDSSLQLVAYIIPESEPEEPDEQINLGDAGQERQNDNLAQFTSSAPYNAKSDAMNTLANIGGRIEAFGNIGINSDRLLNMGLDFNTGKDAASIYYHFVLDKAPSNTGWRELGRNKVNETHLDSLTAYILAGHDIGVQARSVLNQSAHLSSGGNMGIAAEELSNKTSNELFKLAITLQKRKKWKSKVRRKTKRSTDWATQYYSERIYSRTPALISSLGDLLINATSLFNDQVEDTNGFRFGRDPGSDVITGQVNSRFNLPSGPNGIFKMAAPNSRYMVESNSGLMNPGWYSGAEYLFSQIRHDNESRKLLGDPAYETRLVMDSLRNATAGRYLDGDQPLSDVQRMQALYDGSAAEHARLDLQVGLALTPEQVAELTRDIIWYAEEEINGQKVLVPQLYLCPTTLAALASDNFGAKITGNNVNIVAEYLSNSGDIFAGNLLSMKADTLINESNWLNQASIRGEAASIIEAELLQNTGGKISGGVTQLSAGNLLNQTRVYEEAFRKDVTQRTGHTAA